MRRMGRIRFRGMITAYFLIYKCCLLLSRFLYGGSGLWRSASLQKGSDPVLLVAQSSFDETINSRSQRTGSLSGTNSSSVAIKC